MLVVDRHTLLAIDLLNLVDQVHLDRARTQDAQHLLGVDSALDQLVADLDVLTIGDVQA